MARLVYLGNFGPQYSTENDVKKAILSLGHECIVLQENETTIQQIREASIPSDLLLVTGTWDNQDHEEFRSLIYELADKGIPSATLHLDTFWPTKRGGRKWWLENMFQTAYIFTADGDWQDKWKLLGKNHIWLPPAVRHDAAKFGTFRQEYACDVAFVGSNGQGYHEDVWPDRKILVDNLRAMCKKNGWSFKNPGGDQPKIERGDDMNDFYASSKVTVGDSLCLKKEAAKYWSDRVPEATGRGGFLVMPRIKELQKIYPQMPMYTWGNFEGLEWQIKMLLADDDMREKIKQSNFKITRDGHTYIHRVKTVLDIVGVK